MTVFTQKAPIFMARLMMADFAFSVEDAAAIMGNAGHESGGLVKLQEIKPTVAGSRGGYGWFQWTGPRRRAFEAWCKRAGLKPSSDEANYGYLVVELRGDERRAVNLTKNAKGLENKVRAFEAAFERAGVKHYASRIQYAERALQAFRAKPVAPTVLDAPVPQTGDVGNTYVPPPKPPPDFSPIARFVAALVAAFSSLLQRWKGK